jgi:hypothetical protein
MNTYSCGARGVKKALLCLAVSILLFVIGIGAASAASVVGVEVGQWAMYKYTVCTNSTMSPDVNSTHQYIEVLAISGTNITFKDMIIAPNGSTISNRLVWTDVETGNGTDSGWFVGANLTQGDQIFPASSFNWQMIVNETTFRSYLNETVEVNGLILRNVTDSFNNSTLTMDGDYFWIRTSGMMAEFYLNQTIEYQNGTSFWSIMDIMINETGIVAEFPSFLILPLSMTATLLAVVVYKKRSRALRSRNSNRVEGFPSFLGVTSCVWFASFGWNVQPSERSAE